MRSNYTVWLLLRVRYDRTCKRRLQRRPTSQWRKAAESLQTKWPDPSRPTTKQGPDSYLEPDQGHERCFETKIKSSAPSFLLVDTATRKNALDWVSRSDPPHWPLTFDFQSQASFGLDLHTYKLKFKGESVWNIEWKHTDGQTDGRTRPIALGLPWKSAVKQLS